MPHDDTKQSIDRDLVAAIGASVMGSFIAASRDLGAIDDAHLDSMADMAVRAAMSLSASIPRAQDRLKAEADTAARAAEDEKVAEATAAKVAQQDKTDRANQPSLKPHGSNAPSAPEHDNAVESTTISGPSSGVAKAATPGGKAAPAP